MRLRRRYKRMYIVIATYIGFIYFLLLLVLLLGLLSVEGVLLLDLPPLSTFPLGASEARLGVEGTTASVRKARAGINASLLEKKTGLFQWALSDVSRIVPVLVDYFAKKP